MSRSPVHAGLIFRLLARAFAVVSLKGNAHMNLCPVLALSLGLVGGTCCRRRAQLPLYQASADYPCDDCSGVIRQAGRAGDRGDREACRS